MTGDAIVDRVREIIAEVHSDAASAYTMTENRDRELWLKGQMAACQDILAKVDARL